MLQINGGEAKLNEVCGKALLLNAEVDPGHEIKWCEENAASIDQFLNENGALLIRGLRLRGSKKIGRALTALFQDQPMEYNYRSTPRTQMRGNIYTSSEYHRQETIVQHNEAAYSNVWPMRIGFCCTESPETGGQTPITDSHIVYKKIDPEIVDEFERKGLMYVRNYSDVDLPWQEVFQTSDRAQVEAYCRANDISFDWIDDDTLQTRQVNRATQQHPVKKLPVWFNQAHLFHVSSVGAETQKDLINTFGEDRLPRNVYFADGTRIESEALDTIREIYRQEQLVFDWETDDLLLLDNMLFTHGRNPFTGSRKVLVGMAQPKSL